MTATSPTRIAPPTVTPIHERWITSLTDIVNVTAWRDEAIEANPNSIPTTSDSAWVHRQSTHIRFVRMLVWWRVVNPIDEVVFPAELVVVPRESRAQIASAERQASRRLSSQFSQRCSPQSRSEGV